MTLRELVNEGRIQLEQAGVPDAGRDARSLFLDAFHMSSAEYLLYAENTPEKVGFEGDRKSGPAERMPHGAGRDLSAALETYRGYLRMRAERIPLQQILGETGFMGLNFKVSGSTLSPRQDTEVLVEEVLKDYGWKRPKVLDLCTGTGCIGISLGILGECREAVLTDLSGDALEVAACNAEKLGAESGCTFRLYQGDLFEALPAGETFDVIVSNPPYIRDAVIETLEPEVKTYEPRMALSGGEDGLEIYRRLIAAAPAFAPALYLEIGYDQAEAVKQLMEKAGYGSIRIIRDYGGRDRVVTGRTDQTT